MIQYVVTGFSYCNMTPVCSEGRIYTLDAGNTSNKEKTTHEWIHTHTSIRCLYACICLHAHRVFAFSATSNEILINVYNRQLKGTVCSLVIDDVCTQLPTADRIDELTFSSI